MTNNDKWKVVKYIAFAVIILLSVVLLMQYINLGKLSSDNNSLSEQLNSLNTEFAQKEQTKQNLEENYNQFVEDEAKEKYNMKDYNEEVIEPAN